MPSERSAPRPTADLIVPTPACRLGHTQVERIVDLVGEHPVRLDHHERV